MSRGRYKGKGGGLERGGLVGRMCGCVHGMGGGGGGLERGRKE